MRIFVAENAKSPVYVLEILAQDSEREVLLAVAKNIKTPAYLLEYLAQRNNTEVPNHIHIRATVGKNPNATI